MFLLQNEPFVSKKRADRLLKSPCTPLCLYSNLEWADWTQAVKISKAQPVSCQTAFMFSYQFISNISNISIEPQLKLNLLVYDRLNNRNVDNSPQSQIHICFTLATSKPDVHVPIRHLHHHSCLISALMLLFPRFLQTTSCLSPLLFKGFDCKEIKTTVNLFQLFQLCQCPSDCFLMNIFVPVHKRHT